MQVTLGKLLEQVANERPEHEAIVYPDRNLRYTYKQFDHLCRKAANFKISRYIKFCSEYPMTASGKIQKFNFREDTGWILNLQREILIRDIQ